MMTMLSYFVTHTLSCVTGYIQVAPYSGGYGHIHCNGSETTLKDCDIGTVVGECNYVAVVSHCTHGMEPSRTMCRYTDENVYHMIMKV